MSGTAEPARAYSYTKYNSAIQDNKIIAKLLYTECENTPGVNALSESVAEKTQTP
ncbi:hypothetical protein HNR37_001521 [Desulfurispira natronophila]|uniref:Uncharacterized protein n=1 Tax=Desulfurispira natronophila TaxID=682562 RepID=A0A7W7Y4Z4_9BACT|nr:hypothetical protein [Desulfurispira natronophila]